MTQAATPLSLGWWVSKWAREQRLAPGLLLSGTTRKSKEQSLLDSVWYGLGNGRKVRAGMTTEQDLWIMAYWIRHKHGEASLAHVDEQLKLSMLGGDVASAVSWQGVSECLEELQSPALGH